MGMARWFEFLRNLTVVGLMRSAATQAEGWWFDVTRHVQTSGYVPLEGLTLAGPGKSSFEYFPIHPSVARQVLERLPIQNHSEYTFVDLGSGMGRMLLLAAEYPFRKIQGVELAVELHLQAKQNISRCRHVGRRCTDIESINADVSEYRFPNGKLALYLFNPFGPEVLAKVLANLAASIAEQPRHVIVTILNPKFAFVADAMPYLRLYLQTRRFRIYQTDINST
jgi:SAM-dependent methyltransferase